MIRAGMWAAVLVCVCASDLMADTSIRPDPGGKRLLFVEKDGSIRPEPGGKRVLFVDGNDIRPEPGGKRLLFVDGNDIRPEPGGIRLAYIDGHDIRRSPGGKILINYRHPDFRPTGSGDRLMFADGDELTNQQMVAVLYHLKPEIFKLSAAEEEALKKDMKDTAEAEEKEAQKDRAPGKWTILTASGAEKISSGTVHVSGKKGDAYQVRFEHKNDGPDWRGVAIQKQIPPKTGDHLLFVAFGTPKTIGLAVYEVDKGVLKGKWYPWYLDGDKKNVGTEDLKGPENLDGEFTITDAKAPHTGDPYKGTVTIKPADITGAADDAKPYTLTWSIGDKKYTGIGALIKKKYLVVASGAGPDTLIASFKLDTDGTMIGDWYNIKKEKGYYTTNKEQSGE